MQGLLQKLADLDSDVERGVRLIEFFDQLTVHGADLEAVVRATAVLSQCVAGATYEPNGLECVVGPEGYVRRGASPPATASTRPVRVNDRVIGQVWMERTEGLQDWDDLILDRMALTVASTATRGAPNRQGASELLGLSDPAIVQVLLDGDTSEVERSRAIRLLGFAPGQLVALIGVYASTGMHRHLESVRRHIASTTGRHAACTALSDSLGILLISSGPIPRDEFDTTLAICISERVRVENVADSWRSVRRGVRFAALGSPWSRILRVDDLGSLVMLADLPQAEVLASEDVSAIGRIARQHGGDLDLHLLQALCASKSLREAAQETHLHHSSVAYRLGRLSKSLGFDVRDGHNRYRLSTGLLLWGLYGSHPERPDQAETPNRA